MPSNTNRELLLKLHGNIERLDERTLDTARKVDLLFVKVEEIRVWQQGCRKEVFKTIEKVEAEVNGRLGNLEKDKAAFTGVVKVMMMIATFVGAVVGTIVSWFIGKTR